MDVCAALPLRLTAPSCVRQGGAAEAELTHLQRDSVDDVHAADDQLLLHPLQ